MAPLLNPGNYTDYIPDIPETFRLEKLIPIEREVTNGWLRDILGAESLTTYGTLFTTYPDAFVLSDTPFVPVEGVPVTLAQHQTGEAIIKFLVYSVWATHILIQSNAIITDTGYVTKLNGDSERISERQRTELSAYYRGLAEREALELSRLVAIEHPCTPSGYSGRPLIRKAQRPSPSRLGN
jgi:hypothetical protein